MNPYAKIPRHVKPWTDDDRRKLMNLVGTMSLEDLAKEFNCKLDRIRTQCLKQKLSYRFKEG